MGADRDTYRATVRVEALPDPDGVPAAQRVKRWLKLALRGFRLKATDISPAPPPTPADPAGHAAGHAAGQEDPRR
jgi:hypothetical protein